MWRARAQGTAVTVQVMVFGNMGSTSGSGVCFTRSPSTGDKKLYGEYLINAQVTHDERGYASLLSKKSSNLV